MNSFFPQDDSDLAFYQQFEKDFESDNDYLLIALQNENGNLIAKSFLEKCDLIKEGISQLSGVDTLISILDLELPVIGLFGISYSKVFDWENEDKLKQTSTKLSQFKGSLISSDGESLLF
ncbi:hypothetical protein [Algoriphagus boritolerans]|uniref:hypothetical protein n=1 Tax=Algoriphagus boritolerans TaxID=308111 RepID=UPI002FCE1A54